MAPAGQHMSHDEFFEKLATLFSYTRTKTHGTVHLTQKRITEPTTVPSPSQLQDDPLWDTHPSQPVPIVVRASKNKSDKRAGTDRENRPKEKISTVVQPEHLDAFYVRYAEACKVGMGGLKKRDRKKGKKDKKKKKGGVDGKA